MVFRKTCLNWGSPFSSSCLCPKNKIQVMFKLVLQPWGSWAPSIKRGHNVFCKMKWSNKCFELWNWTSDSFCFHLVKYGPFTDLYIKSLIFEVYVFLWNGEIQKVINILSQNRRFKKWNDYDQNKLLATGILTWFLTSKKQALDFFLANFAKPRKHFKDVQVNQAFLTFFETQ